VSPKLLEESGLLELFSSSWKFWSSPASCLDANCWDLSFPTSLKSSNSFIRAWLRKEAVKKLLHKHGETLRTGITCSENEVNAQQWKYKEFKLEKYLHNALWQHKAWDKINMNKPSAGWTKHPKVIAVSAVTSNGLILRTLTTCFMNKLEQVSQLKHNLCP